MENLHWLVIILSILSLSTDAASEHDSDLLPQSVLELKQYYDMIDNLQKRGIVNPDIVNQEKRLYIEHASKLARSPKLLSEEEFRTWKQRQLIVSFSNIIAIIAGIIVTIALTTLLGIFILPVLTAVPVHFWELLFYIISISLMLLMNNSWLIFFGCLGFVATLSFTIKLHFSQDKYIGLKASWLCFFLYSIVAIYQQNREVAYLAVMALESALGFVVFVGQLVIVIGFQNETVVPCATIASSLLIVIGSILHLQQRSNIFTVPFTRPLLFLGTFVYFIGMLILTSRLYTEWRTKKQIFWVLQGVAFLSGLATMFFGPMLEIPFIQAIGGTMFVIWLLEKYVEFAPWGDTLLAVGSLLGFGLLLYGSAYFLQTHPEYFIFHSYSTK